MKGLILPQCRRPRFSSWGGKFPWRRDRLPTPVFLGFPGGSDSKESTCNAGDLGSIPGLGRSLEEGMATHSTVLAWRIPMDRGACPPLWTPWAYIPWGHKESAATEWLSTAQLTPVETVTMIRAINLPIISNSFFPPSYLSSSSSSSSSDKGTWYKCSLTMFVSIHFLSFNFRIFFYWSIVD